MYPEMPKASSCMLVLPMMIAPAARNLAATGASLFGTEALQCRRAGAGGQPRHLDIVLDHERHATKRRTRPLPAPRIKGLGGLHGARLIQGDEGVEIGIGPGAVKRCRCQRLAGDLACADVGRGLRHRQLVEIERLLRNGGCR
ncbi:hypothetical protein ACVWZ4_003385 [Bradyrhizobium sp. USDA 4472]